MSVHGYPADKSFCCWFFPSIYSTLAFHELSTNQQQPADRHPAARWVDFQRIWLANKVFEYNLDYHHVLRWIVGWSCQKRKRRYRQSLTNGKRTRSMTWRNVFPASKRRGKLVRCGCTSTMIYCSCGVRTAKRTPMIMPTTAAFRLG